MTGPRHLRSAILCYLQLKRQIFWRFLTSFYICACRLICTTVTQLQYILYEWCYKHIHPKGYIILEAHRCFPVSFSLLGISNWKPRNDIECVPLLSFSDLIDDSGGRYHHTSNIKLRIEQIMNSIKTIKKRLTLHCNNFQGLANNWWQRRTQRTALW